jgi:hypothetical protein
MNDNLTTQTKTSASTLCCANHPDTETTLRCNRCEKPICTRCAVLTPTGYRCKECVRGQQKTFNTAEWYDYILGIAVAAILSYIGSLIVPRLGFFTIFLAPIAGTIIAEAARAVVRRHRSKLLFQLTTAAAAIGSLGWLLPALAILLVGGGVGFGGLLSVIWEILYTVTVTTTVYYRLSGIRMNI